MIVFQTQFDWIEFVNDVNETVECHIINKLVKSIPLRFLANGGNDFGNDEDVKDANPQIRIC